MKSKKALINLILAFLSTLALSFNYTVVEETDRGNFVVNFLAKLPDVFSQSYIVDIVLFVALFFLFDRFLKEKIDVLSAIVSGIFGFLFVMGQSFKTYGNMLLFMANTFQLFMAIITWLGLSILFYLLITMLIEALNNAKLHEAEGDLSPKKVFWISFIAIFICYLVWSLLNCPGTFNPDAEQQIDQVLGNNEWENVHPPFGSIIMGGLYKFGLNVGAPNLGAYLYILLQNTVCAFAFAYMVKKSYEWGCGKKAAIWMLLFFAINPFWLTYAQLYNKDQLYIGVMTFFTIFIADIIIKKEVSVPDIVKLTLTALVAALLRKNGIYSIVPTLFVLIFVIKKTDRKKLISILAGVIIVYELVNKVLYPALGIKDGSIREALSIPFQQTANYVKYHGDDVTKEEQQIIDEVLDYDVLAENYTPFISSPVKDTYKEDSTKLPAYFGIWAKMFFKHPDSYVNAFINQTYGYLTPVYSDLAGVDSDEQKWEKRRGMTHMTGSGPQIVKQTKNMAEQTPIIKYLGDPGLYTWILVLATILLLKKKKYKEEIFFVPNIVNLLVCFASPANGSSRYALPFIAMTPIYIFWVVKNYKNDAEI